MMPEENWWPVDEMWNYHSGRNQFNTIENYHEALDARYGEAADLEDFARKAQIANYEGMRAMFEAFSIRRPRTTGIIQWMLNSAWPEMYWQLYDHYLVPNGAFYGARDALRPINIALDRADRGIVVVNDTTSPLAGVTMRVRVLDLQSTILSDESQVLDVPAETIHQVLNVAPVATAGKTYFLDARLTASDGTHLASSLYWLSTQDDVPDWDASEWYYTPTAKFADLSGLATLPEVELLVEHRFEDEADGQAVHVSLENPSDRIAFFVELSVVGADSGQLAAPILWSDNYVSLLPGERREVWASIPGHALEGESPELRFQGPNVTGR
jgi:exo-1,4-beta-D-glucosaminidase